MSSIRHRSILLGIILFFIVFLFDTSFSQAETAEDEMCTKADLNTVSDHIQEDKQDNNSSCIHSISS